MSKFMVLPAGDHGVCPDTKRYYVLFYVAIKKKEFFVNVSCEDYLFGYNDFKDLSIEFLNYHDMNAIEIPYDAELFDEIESVAKLQFEEFMLEEVTNGESSRV